MLTCCNQSALCRLREHAVVNAQLRLGLRSHEVFGRRQRLGDVHDHGNGRRGSVLCKQEGKDVQEDVALRVVGSLLGQKREVPETGSQRRGKIKKTTFFTLICWLV